MITELIHPIDHNVTPITSTLSQYSNIEIYPILHSIYNKFKNQYVSKRECEIIGKHSEMSACATLQRSWKSRSNIHILSSRNSLWCHSINKRKQCFSIRLDVDGRFVSKKYRLRWLKNVFGLPLMRLMAAHDTARIQKPTRWSIQRGM